MRMKIYLNVAAGLLLACGGCFSSSEMKPKPLSDDERSIFKSIPSQSSVSFNEEVSALRNVNFRNEDGMTPLMLCAVYDRTDKMKMLIEHNASLNLQDLSGNTALIIAASNGNLASVKLLMEDGASAEIENSSGATALAEAARTGRPEIVTYLLNCGVDVNHKDKNKTTVLMRAARAKVAALETVKILVENKADIKAQDNAGIPAAGYAIGASNIEVFKYFLSLEPDMLKDQALSFPMLKKAIYRKDLPAVQVLVESGVPVNRDRNSMVLAAERTDLNAITRGLSRSKFMDDGRTPLMWAAESGNPDIVKYLIEKGADVNAKDSAGKTVMDFSANIIIRNILKSAGAW